MSSRGLGNRPSASNSSGDEDDTGGGGGGRLGKGRRGTSSRRLSKSHSGSASNSSSGTEDPKRDPSSSGLRRGGRKRNDDHGDAAVGGGGDADFVRDGSGGGGGSGRRSSVERKGRKNAAAGAADAAAFSPDPFTNFADTDVFSPTKKEGDGWKNTTTTTNDDLFGDAMNSTSAAAWSPQTTPTKAAFGNNSSSSAAAAADTFDMAGFGAADFGGAANFASAFDTAFDTTAMAIETVPPLSSTTKEPEWDCSPHTSVPDIPNSTLKLKSKMVLRKQFWGAPVENPLNGNILFAATGTTGILSLHEVDPENRYAQSNCIPSILSDELCDKIATKYGVTVCSVETVWTLAAGTHLAASSSSLSSTARMRHVRVAAICDFRVLENPGTSLRLIVVWLWNATPTPTLQYVLSPPSGGDFVYNVSTLQVADGLFLVAGSSPKGACVFISKPAVREAWSANFLTGSGTVTAMQVHPSRPDLVIALTDGSVTVWTYRAALSRAAVAPAKAKTTKRWLFPLCRLDATKAMATVNPVFPGTNEKAATAEERGRRFGRNEKGYPALL
jgi:hypothetical protein